LVLEVLVKLMENNNYGTPDYALMRIPAKH
jgi:hypothetical protein